MTVFRQSGATNVTWLWVMSGDSPAAGHVQQWWPGARYVDWIGVDGYYFTPANTFSTVIGNTVRNIRKFTRKPVLLSEVGIGPRAGQAAKIAGLFAGIRRDHLLGLVYFDVNQHQGLYHQDWRLDDNPAAVAAFRAGVRSAERSHQGGAESSGGPDGQAAPRAAGGRPAERLRCALWVRKLAFLSSLRSSSAGRTRQPGGCSPRRRRSSRRD